MADQAKALDEALRRKRLKYRETFKTDDDLLVLIDILTECGYYAMHNKQGPMADWSPEETLARERVAKYILWMLGCVQPLNALDGMRAMKQLPFE